MAESHVRAETPEARCFRYWSSPKIVSLTGSGDNGCSVHKAIWCPKPREMLVPQSRWKLGNASSVIIIGSSSSNSNNNKQINTGQEEGQVSKRWDGIPIAVPFYLGCYHKVLPTIGLGLSTLTKSCPFLVRVSISEIRHHDQKQLED